MWSAFGQRTNLWRQTKTILYWHLLVAALQTELNDSGRIFIRQFFKYQVIVPLCLSCYAEFSPCYIRYLLGMYTVEGLVNSPPSSLAWPPFAGRLSAGPNQQSSSSLRKRPTLTRGMMYGGSWISFIFLTILPYYSSPSPAAVRCVTPSSSTIRTSASCSLTLLACMFRKSWAVTGASLRSGNWYVGFSSTIQLPPSSAHRPICFGFVVFNARVFPVFIQHVNFGYFYYFAFYPSDGRFWCGANAEDSRLPGQTTPSMQKRGGGGLLTWGNSGQHPILPSPSQSLIFAVTRGEICPPRGSQWKGRRGCGQSPTEERLHSPRSWPGRVQSYSL